MGEKEPHLSIEEQERFNKYVIKAKECATNGDIEEAIKLNKKAYSIYQVEKIANRIKNLKEHLANEQNENQNREDETSRHARYVEKAKELSGTGRIAEAVSLLKKAQEIINTDKVARRIKRMEDYLHANENESEEEDGDGDMINLGDGFMIFKELSEKIYSHQKEGVLWMWGLHKRNKGGILADDMGLGKTIQVVAFLSGLFDMEEIKTVLIVLPVAVILNWQREFEKWAPGINVYEYHGSSKRERERSLSKVYRRGGVLLTSYGLVVNCHEQLAQPEGTKFSWDYVVLDEGHKIKNTGTKCAKGVHSIRAKHRIILTGTPIQNNLKELWSLFDWCQKGQLLGNARTFKQEFENPIKRAREKDATVGEQRFGQEMAERLNKMIRPYLLRRTKGEVTQTRKSQTHDSNGQQVAKMPTFTRKNDLVCWIFLSDVQQRIYEEFSSSEEVRQLLNTSKSPLVALNVLKKICDHPRLLTNKQCHELKLDMDEEFLKNEAKMPEHLGAQSAVDRIGKLPVEQLIEESGKMGFLVELLDNLKAEGHRTLVFSMARRILDIIERVMTERGHKVARLDGTIAKLEDREKIIQRFIKNKNITVFLLTTQVGGVGLTITAADRVVIYDPSWNPATDAQAVDRCFRIGQDKNVVVYRLITCGSIEEKIYRRQVFKDSINKQTQGDAKNPYRYFTKMDLRDLFFLDNPRVSTTQQQINELHRNQRKSDTSLDAHIAFLSSLDIYGISDHDLLFSKEAAPTEDHELVEGEAEHIENKADMAQRMITQESESHELMVEEMGYYPAPEVFKTAAPPRREPMVGWNFPQPATTTYDDDDEVQVVSGIGDLKLKGEQEEVVIPSSDEDESFQDTDKTPVKPFPDTQPSSIQRIMNMLQPFKGNASSGSETASPTVGTPKGTTSDSLLGKVRSFFTQREAASPASTAAADAAAVLELGSPIKSIVQGIGKSMPVAQTTKETTLFDDDDDDDDDDNITSNTQDSSVNGGIPASPVVTIDDTPVNTPSPRQANKFMQQAMLKSKKGCEDAPICVDNTPVVNETPEESLIYSRTTGNLETTPLRRPLGNIPSISNKQNRSPLPQSPARGYINDEADDDFDNLPPITCTPRSSKKNKRRSVCALPTPRRDDDRPVSPSASPTSGMDNVVTEDVIVSPKAFDPILAMSPRKVSGTKMMSISQDMTLDGYEAFTAGAHLDSTVIGSTVKRGPAAAVYDQDELGNISSPAYQGKKKKARTSSSGESSSNSMTESRSLELSSVTESPGLVASDTDDESSVLAPKRLNRSLDSDTGDTFLMQRGVNRSLESDTGDTPVARTTKRTVRVIESDDEPSEEDMVQDSADEQESSLLEISNKKGALQNHLKTFIEDSEENETESEDEQMESAPSTPNNNRYRRDSICRLGISSGGDHEDTKSTVDDENDVSNEEEEAMNEENDNNGGEEEEDEEDEESESDEEVDEEDMEKYVDLMKQSREQYKSNNLKEALSLALDALEIYDKDERAKNYAQRLHRKILEKQ